MRLNFGGEPRTISEEFANEQDFEAALSLTGMGSAQAVKTDTRVAEQAAADVAAATTPEAQAAIVAREERKQLKNPTLRSDVFVTGEAATAAGENQLKDALSTALADNAPAIDTSTPGGKIVAHFEKAPADLKELAQMMENKKGDLRSPSASLSRSTIEKKIAPAIGVTGEEVIAHVEAAWQGAKVGSRTDRNLFLGLLQQPDPLAVEAESDAATRYRQAAAAPAPIHARAPAHFNSLVTRLESQGFDVQRIERELGQGEDAFTTGGIIGVVMEDIANANLTNVVSVIHEVGHKEVDKLGSGMRDRLSRAVDRTIAEVKDGRLIKAAKNANQNWEEKLVETTAIKLGEEGFGEQAASLAQAIWRAVKDLYHRVGMSLLRALGVEPSDTMVLAWWENNLRRRLGGDYDFRYIDLFRPIIERSAERVARFTIIDGQDIADLLDPLTGAVRRAEVLPDTADAAEWNLNRYPAAPVSAPAARQQSTLVMKIQGVPAALPEVIKLTQPVGWSQDRLHAAVQQAVTDELLTAEDAGPLSQWIDAATPVERKEVWKNATGARFSDRHIGSDLDMDYTESMARITKQTVLLLVAAS